MGNLLGSVAVAGVVDEDVVAQDHRVKPTRLVLAGAVLGRGLRCQQRHVCNQRGSGSEMKVDIGTSPSLTASALTNKWKEKAEVKVANS